MISIFLWKCSYSLTEFECLFFAKLEYDITKNYSTKKKDSLKSIYVCLATVFISNIMNTIAAVFKTGRFFYSEITNSYPKFWIVIYFYIIHGMICHYIKQIYLYKNLNKNSEFWNKKWLDLQRLFKTRLSVGPPFLSRKSKFISEIFKRNLTFI